MDLTIANSELLLFLRNLCEIKILWRFFKSYVILIKTFIRSCVNRFSWWNKSCDSRFTQLSIEAYSVMNGKLYYFCDLIKDWFFIIILRVIIYMVYLETFNARFQTAPYTSEFDSTLIYFWTFNISQIFTVILNNF